MGFTHTLVEERLSRSPAPTQTSRQQIGSVVHRRTSPTACEIRDNGGALTYGAEIPIQFEVSPRPVLYRSSRRPDSRSDPGTMLSLLAINRLEARIAGQPDADAWRGRDLVIAAWPYSFGMVCPSRFRSRIKTNRERQLEQLADKHRDDLFGLLRELDGLDDDLLPDVDLPAIEPTLTVPDQVVAGRYLLDRFDPANRDKRVRFNRDPQNRKGDGDPGWVLGLCDFERCLAALEPHHEQIGADAWKSPWIAKRAKSIEGLRDSVLAEAVPMACKLALAGFSDADARSEAQSREGTESPSVVGNATFLCVRLVETRAASEARAAKPSGSSLAMDPGDDDPAPEDA